MTEQESATAHGDMGVVTLIVTMAIKLKHEQEFLDYMAKFATQVHANEPGTVLYVLTKHPTEPHTYVLVERYSNEDALKAHSETAHMAEAWSTLSTWWTKQPEVLRLGQVTPN